MKKMFRAFLGISSTVFLIAGGISIFVSDDWLSATLLFMASAILSQHVAIEDLEEKMEKL